MWMNECKKGREQRSRWGSDTRERYLPDCWKYEVAEDYDLKVIVLDRMDIVDIDELEKEKVKR